ncbi:hypothetical protein RJ640_029980 [Escallonia rubra]|uniref:Tf2-1-like SH3-like domain-containing protein n=1 Tax=Escallonia rubra TaxID=112253 RepID=A0AA88UF77_9ASTE|nr:hypothetical protein RJ640_029980 [Escallonia rubra]
MANTKERIDALEAQIQSMFKGDEDAPGILKQFSIRLDALEVNLEASDNARYAENMDWEGKFQELHDRVEHHTRHTEGIDWESKFQELQDRAFSALMLDISDMSAVDRLFFFMEGLKPWARTELNRRRVNNLNEAIIAAESLSDYNSEPQRPPQRGNPSRSNGVKKPGSQAPNQSWGSKSSWASNSSTLQKSGVGFKAKPDASTSGEVKKPAFRGCFLCQGPHVIANCPQRQMMNAFFDNMGQVQRGGQSGSQSRHPPTEEQTDAQDYEEEDAVGAFPQWCNAVTTQVGNPEESSTGEKPKDMPPKKKSDVPGKGLMYVDIKVNGKAIRAMVDTGATHNYISSTEVERLGLTLEKGCGRVKAINSAAQPVAGIARSVLIKIGPYEGRTNFSVVTMDDFKLILGLEFLRDTKTTVMPCTNSLAMLGSKPCVIPTARWQELLAEFNFMLEYRAGSTNSVADALSRRAELNQVALMAMNAIVRADSRVAINIGQKIKKALTRDPVAQQLLKLIESGKSAFEIVNGQQPLLPHTVNVPNAGKSPRAISFSEEWRQNIDLAHSYLEKAARRMKKHADKNRRSQEFNVGDKVMVKLLPQDRKFLRGRDSRLLQKYEGPLTIVKKIGKMAYRVDPPNWWSRQLHPVFHVSMLKPFYEDGADPSRGQIRRPGLKPKAAGKRVAEAILNDRVITASRKRHQEYLVKLLRFVGGLFLQEASRVPHTVSFVPSKATVCQVVSEPRLSQKTVASAKRIVWDSLLRKTMANTKERIDALEAQIQSMFKGDEDAPGILKQFSIRLDALEVNLEASDNARYAENMDWEGKFQELHDRVEHHTRHTEGIDWESKFQELQDRAFSALMLDISDMSAVDRLFFFMEGLKPWARTELNRRRVNNLNEAIIAAESLSDYNSEPQRPPQRGNPSRSNGVKKPGSQAPNQSWGSKSSWASNSSTLQKSGVGFKAKPDASTSGEVKKPAFRGCFLCQGPHVIANCPQRQMMNAFFDNMGQVQRGGQSGSQSRHPPTEEQTDAQDYEEEDAVGAFPQWCNAVTTQVGNPEESSTGEKPKDMPPKKKSDVPGKGLMYVDIKVNGKAIRAMVDTGATHNYISSTEVERLGLTLEKGCGRVKAINSAAQPVAGIARSVLIKIGPYEGRTNFSVVTMDDFKLILGLEFLRDTKTTVMPCTNSLAMLGSKPCVIPTVSTRAGERSISALQLKKGLKRDETTYLAMLRWQELLAEFNFMLEYRAGSTNSVADALSRRAELNQVALMAMNAIVRADSRVAINIGQKIKKALTRDPVAQQLLKLIESGKSAFEIVNGQQPLLPHTVNVPNAGKSPRAISFSEEWRQNIDLAHSYLEKAARRMKKHADKNRRSQEFNVGDKVMVKLLPQDRKFLRGRDSRLLQKYEGPLTIVKKIGKMAYRVDPPNWWSRQLHPVFHVSMLKPFYEDGADPSRGQIRRPGLKPKAAGKRVAEAILNDRVITASRKRHQEYLVNTAPMRPSNTRPCALASSSSLAPIKHSARAPICSARARQKPTMKI